MLEDGRVARPHALDPADLRELLEIFNGDAVRHFVNFSATRFVERRVEELTIADPEALDAASEMANAEAAEALGELFDDAWRAVNPALVALNDVARKAAELSSTLRAQLREPLHALEHLGAK